MESRLLSHFTHRRWRAACEQSARLREESWFCGFQDLSAGDVPALRAVSQEKKIVNHLVQDCVTLFHSSLIPPTPVCPVHTAVGGIHPEECLSHHIFPQVYCKIQPLKYTLFLHVKAFWRYCFALMRMCCHWYTSCWSVLALVVYSGVVLHHPPIAVQ